MKKHTYTNKYLVGIDLGTTHTVVAYVDNSAPNKTIKLFEIPQMIDLGEVAAKPLLPSTRYHPAIGEINTDAGFLLAEDGAIIGEAARRLGAKTTGRLVSSAKSWLSHPGVDHSVDILPWGSDASVFKVSPIVACASYLQHVRNTWDLCFPENPINQQTVVITVPASFDDSARSLTLEAANLAAFKNVRLLEEPQAVCYDWLHRHASDMKTCLNDSRLLLICDVGGGTTDLTLIKIEPGITEPQFSRIGVGDHLMLGGDNIDLALAYLAESRLRTADKKLSSSELSQLLEQCRIAKERLLTNDAPDLVQVSLLGSGSKLIGGTRTTALSRDEIRQIALDGFLPLSSLNDLPDKKRSGVMEFGLPYAAEPAISKHIAAFLQMHTQAAAAALGGDGIVPDALLLNGGVFQSSAMVQRIVELLTSWRGKPPLVLDNPNPELAVAYGAVSYAMARLEKKIKISGGAPRSYFLLIENDSRSVKQGVCILPKGSEEGHEILLTEQKFSLRIGQPVRFHLLSTSGAGHYLPGSIVEINDDNFHSLPPLAVAFDSQYKAEVMVQLLTAYTEFGTLQLQCVAVDDATQRWDVEFQIRKNNSEPLNVRLPAQFPQAKEKIEAVFGAKSKQVEPQAVKTLRNDLEKIFSLPRTEWQTPLLRELFTILLAGSKYRRRSDAHERLWLNLTGFCLRPGFGYPLDDWRVEQLWKIYPENLQFVTEKQNWTEWWTFWRRLAGGLTAEAQLHIFNDIAKFINPASARQSGISKQITTRGYEDMVRLAAALERLPIQHKSALGTWLLKRLDKPGEPEQSWWALGRIGARILFHGNSHEAIPLATAEIWLQQILAVDWKKQPQAAFAATLLARRCDDRARDIDEHTRLLVIEKLKQMKAVTSWIDMVAEFKQLDEQQEKQMFGEALPPGLKLIN